MTANTTPIYTQIPRLGAVPVTAANTRSDGVGTIATDIFLAFTASADGAFISKVRFVATATTAATATAATTARVFVSSVTSGATTASNTSVVAEVNLPVTTAAHATTPAQPVDVPLNIAIPPNATILVTCHVAPNANTAWKALVVAGDYS